MSKYIDAEKLIKRLEDMKQAEYENCGGVNAKTGDLQEVQELIESLQPEQPEVDLDAIVNEAFDKYSSVDGYGQLSVSFNRAELYSFIKKIAGKEGENGK